MLGLLVHPGNCNHSPLDYLLGYCCVPVTIASGHKAGIQQPCSENTPLMLHSCSNSNLGCVCCFIPALPAGKLRHGGEMWLPGAAGAEPSTDLPQWGLQREGTAWDFWDIWVLLLSLRRDNWAFLGSSFQLSWVLLAGTLWVQHPGAKPSLTAFPLYLGQKIPPCEHLLPGAVTLCAPVTSLLALGGLFAVRTPGCCFPGEFWLQTGRGCPWLAWAELFRTLGPQPGSLSWWFFISRQS